jgi:hypothetical protein
MQKTAPALSTDLHMLQHGKAGDVSLFDNNGLWPSALILVGNATLIVSKRAYM